MTRDWKIGICGVAFVAIGLLAYALFGRPPYALFSLLKYTVAVSAGLGAWALYKESKRYLPLSLCFLLVGGIHLFGRMRRSDCALFDWSAIASLLVLVAILLVNLLRRTPSTGRSAHVQHRPRIR